MVKIKLVIAQDQYRIKFDFRLLIKKRVKSD